MRNLGLVFSSRLQSFLLALLGVWIIFFAGTMVWQITSGYAAGQGFDADVSQVWSITLILFMPYLLVTGYMLRALARRIAFYRLIRRQIVIAEYEPPKVMSPAEAGLLVDDDFSLAELAATLKDLELRGKIKIDESDKEFTISLITKKDVRLLEEAFLNNLFRGRTSFSTLDPGNRQRLLSAGWSLAAATRDELVYTGKLPRIPWYRNALRGAFKVFLMIALFVQTVTTIGLISSPKEVLSISYPRYPMNIGEPILVVSIVLLTFIIIFSGFWTRTLTDNSGVGNWRYVAGLNLYLAKVYKRRFFNDGKQTVSKHELKTFYPYAIALGIDKEFARRFKRALFL